MGAGGGGWLSDKHNNTRNCKKAKLIQMKVDLILNLDSDKNNSLFYSHHFF